MWGFGFWVLGLGIWVLGLGFGFRVLGLEVWGLRFRVWGLGHVEDYERERTVLPRREFVGEILREALVVNLRRGLGV